MKKIRKRLTYANVMSSIAVFLVLGGGAAFAATQLPNNSVGTKQLKKNAVSTAKLRKNAVSTAKLRKNAISTAKIRKNAINTARLKANAVTTGKLRGNAVTGPKINAPTTPFSQVTARLRAAGPFGFGGVVPISLGAYAQPAGETDQFIAGATVNFDPACTAPRSAVAYLARNPADPNKPESNIAAVGVVLDETGASNSHKMEFTPLGFFEGIGGMQSFEPATTENQVFYAYLVDLECSAGGGGTVSNIGLDVIGTK